MNSDTYPDDEALTFQQGGNSHSNDLNLVNEFQSTIVFNLHLKSAFVNLDLMTQEMEIPLIK